MEVCTTCATTFFQTSWKITMVLVVWTIAAVALFLLKRKEVSEKKKLVLLYTHIATFLFPFLFYSFFRGCEQLSLMCNKPASISLIGLVSIGVATILTTVIAPLLSKRAHERKAKKLEQTEINSFIDKTRNKNRLPDIGVYLIDKAKPIAFSITRWKASLFISVGLVDLLTKKELEAVLLHELGHIKHDTSKAKLRTTATALFAPVAWFALREKEKNSEERKADEFAVAVQNTEKYLESAKEKVSEFYLQENTID